MRRQTAALVLAWVLAVAVPGGAQTAADGALPADIFAESGNRLPLVRPAARGVEAIRLHASDVDDRWQSPLGRQLTELAILTTAREHDQPYEWSLHEIEALAVGLEPAVIELVRHRRPPAGLDEKQTVIVELGRDLFSTLRAALEAFGERNLVDLVDLMARHVADATLLAAFDQRLR
jgi:hypothetical protein